MNRRNWLRTMTGAGLAMTLPTVTSRVFALPAQADARFLLVFLRGGYDAANVLVPSASDFYYAARPNIAIRRPVADGATPDPAAALALGAAPREAASG